MFASMPGQDEKLRYQIWFFSFDFYLDLAWFLALLVIIDDSEYVNVILIIVKLKRIYWFLGSLPTLLQASEYIEDNNIG